MNGSVEIHSRSYDTKLTELFFLLLQPCNSVYFRFSMWLVILFVLKIKSWSPSMFVSISSIAWNALIRKMSQIYLVLSCYLLEVSRSSVFSTNKQKTVFNSILISEYLSPLMTKSLATYWLFLSLEFSNLNFADYNNTFTTFIDLH